LHQDFATWLEAKGAGRIVEYEEIIGYHLEQAYRYREALGPVGVDERLLAEAAAERLARAGRRALNLGAAAAAANLLERATALLPSRDPARVEMLLVLSHAIEVGIGDSPRAVSVADEAARAAEALGDEALQAHATITGLVLRMRTDTASAVAQAEAAAAKALPIFEARGDAAGLAKTWRLLAWPPYLKAHAAETEQALERAVAHGRDAGDRWEESENLSYLAENAWRGPRPIEDALVRCDQILAQAGRDRRLKASIDQHRAILESWRGDFDKARALVADSRASFAELGLKGDMPFSSWVAAQVELAADDPLAAESELRRALEAPGDEESTLTAALGESLYRQERFNDARACADRAERAAALLRDGVQARGLGARLLARAGLSADAELAAREAVERADSSDYLYLRANALMDLAEVLRLALRMDEAVASVTAALKLYEQKGATASAARARALLDQL
jgi:tetratricopeptide (TPR) repeat protein